eukprot:scaffold139_cov325-Pavlova_lutheri.AAC.5
MPGKHSCETVVKGGRGGLPPTSGTSKAKMRCDGHHNASKTWSRGGKRNPGVEGGERADARVSRLQDAIQKVTSRSCGYVEPERVCACVSFEWKVHPLDQGPHFIANRDAVRRDALHSRIETPQ